MNIEQKLYDICMDGRFETDHLQYDSGRGMPTHRRWFDKELEKWFVSKHKIVAARSEEIKQVRRDIEALERELIAIEDLYDTTTVILTNINKRKSLGQRLEKLKAKESL